MKLLTLTLLSATGANAFFGAKEPPKPKPHIHETFTFADPALDPTISDFEPSCEHVAVVPAKEYTLNDLQVPAPKGLREWAIGLKALFAEKEYPGSWGGLDRHLHDRTILSMEYKDVPLAVKNWIEEQEVSGGPNKGLFGVFAKPTETDEEGKPEKVKEVFKFEKDTPVDRTKDEEKIMIFAPGAIYHILPLWGAETSSCKDTFLDLSNYQVKPEDGKVVGWVEHKKPNERDMEFRVKLQALKAKAKAKEAAGEAVKEEKTETKEEL